MIQPLSLKLYNKIFGRGTDKPFDELDLTGTHYEPYVDIIIPNIKFLRDIPWEIIELKSFDGAKLRGYYYDQGSEKTAVINHGYRSHYLSNAACPGRYFIDEGYNVLIIVSRGHENSEGEYITFGAFEYKDLLLWLEKLENEMNCKDIVLYGVSLGSHVVMRASEFINSEAIRAMILDCGFINTKSTLRKQVRMQAKPKWLKWAIVPVSIPYIELIRKWGIKKGGFDINTGDTRTALKNSKLPAFFIHGERDQIVPIKYTLTNYEVCPNKKELFISKNAQHGAAFAAGGEELAAKIRDFLAEFV